MPPTRIYLTGFMGSGKSTAGPFIAQALGYEFADLDKLIVAKDGRPIPQIFAEEGEAGFRQIEAETLQDTTVLERMVIALGGGALVSEENLQLAKANGLVIYFNVSVDDLVRRLMQSDTERPLLVDASGRLTEKEVRTRIKELLARREPFYSRAHVIIDRSGQEIPETVEAVLQAIRSFDPGKITGF